MRIIGGIATQNSRSESLKRTLISLNNQSIKIDKLYIYNNDMGIDYTDNAKFMGLKDTKPGDVYLSLDDDIHYYEDYVKDMLDALELYQVITHHGRIIDTNSDTYHRGNHKIFPCIQGHYSNHLINILGTGVSGYRLDDYDIINQLYYTVFNNNHRMTDLLVSNTLYDMKIPIFCRTVIKGDFEDLTYLNTNSKTCLDHAINNPFQINMQYNILRNKIKQNNNIDWLQKPSL